jgi:hypothetical protein
MIQMILRFRSRSIRTVVDRPRAEITRRWVETADERCPLACVWFALPEMTADQDDESELPRPAFSTCVRRQAVCTPFTFLLHHLY